MLSSTSTLAEIVAPAAGAPVTQVLIAATFSGAMTCAALLIAWLHTTGRTTLLTRFSDWLGRIEGLPGWAALPIGIAQISLTMAFIGVYWDISLHIDHGRDPGPLANIAHYPILFGLQGLFVAGILAMALPPKGSYVGPSAIQVTPKRRIPTASLLLLGSSILGYLGFPFDDIWHRLFGQDVTLWGPTHLMMIFGAVLAIIPIALLQVEGERAYGPPRSKSQKFFRRRERVFLPMALLIGGTLLAGEFDWGIQQYRMVWEPTILAGVAALGLTIARQYIGPGGAIQAMIGYTVARFLVDLFVGSGLGETAPHMPLYVVEALTVEAVALAPMLRDRKLTQAICFGLAIGTVGFAAQYGWSQFAMPTPWTTRLLGEGIPSAILAGIGGAVLGSLLVTSLRGELSLVKHARVVGGLATGALLLVGINNTVHTSTPGPAARIAVVSQNSDGGAGDRINVQFSPVGPSDKALFVQSLSWQGGGLIVDNLKKIGPGHYIGNRAVPAHGKWKTMVRMQTGRSLLAAPVYMPADPGIPVAAHINPGVETVQMRDEQVLMQRERKQDVPTWIWGPAIILVLGMIMLFSVVIALGAARVGRRVTPVPVDGNPRPTGGGDAKAARSEPSPARRPSATPSPGVAYWADQLRGRPSPTDRPTA